MRKNILKHLLAVWAIAGLIQLFGCSAGSGGGGSSSVAIKGVAQAGPINGAVRIYEIDARGERGAVLGSQENVVDGVFEIRVPTSENPVIVAATGYYKDEATGLTVDMKGQELTQVIPNTKDNSEVPVTPATTFVAEMIQEKIRKGELLRIDAKSAIEESHQKVAQLFGVDTATIKAIPKPPEKIDSQTEAGKASLLLSVFSQAMRDGNLTQDKGVNPVESINKLSAAVAKKGEPNQKVSGDDFQNDPKLKDFANNWATILKDNRDTFIQTSNLSAPADWTNPKADVGTGSVNLPPVANEDTIKVVGTLPERSLYALDPNGDPVQFIVVSPPSKGTIQWVKNNRGSFHFVPLKDSPEFFYDSFKFVASDGKLPSEPVTVNLIRIPSEETPSSSDLALVGSSDGLFSTIYSNNLTPTLSFNFWGGAKIAQLYQDNSCRGNPIGASDLSALKQPGSATIKVDGAHSLNEGWQPLSLKLTDEKGGSSCNSRTFTFDTSAPTIEQVNPRPDSFIGKTLTDIPWYFDFLISGDSEYGFLYREDNCQGTPIGFKQFNNLWPGYILPQPGAGKLTAYITVGSNGYLQPRSLDSSPFSSGQYSFSIKIVDLAGNATCIEKIPFVLAPNPRILSIAPARGYIGDSVTVSGVDFQPDTKLQLSVPAFSGATLGGSSISKTAYSGIVPDGTCQFISSTKLTCKVPNIDALSSLPSDGIQISLQVNSVSGQAGSQPSQFRLLPRPIPKIIYASYPPSGPVGTTLNFSGTGLAPGMVLKARLISCEGGAGSVEQVLCNLGDSNCELSEPRPDNNYSVTLRKLVINNPTLQLPACFVFYIPYSEGQIAEEAYAGRFELSAARSENPEVSYYKNSMVFNVGTTITKLFPTVQAIDPVTYTVQPALPNGLTLDSSSGVISGTPTSVSAQQNYTVTAKNARGSGSFTLNIEVLELLSVAAEAKDRAITVTWNSISGASSYNLYWSQTFPVNISQAEKITNVRGPYIHSNVADGQVYYYVVSAVSVKSGLESDTGPGTGPNSDGSTTRENIIYTELPNSSVTCITGDLGKKLYVGTRNGLAISKDGGKTFKLALKNIAIRSVVLREKNIYVGTQNSGFFISDDGGVSFQTVYNVMNSSGYYDIVSIVVDMGKMYIATTEGLAISNRVCNYGQCKTVFKQVKLFPAADYQPINALAISGGAIYAGTGFGLFISRDKDSGVFFGPVYLSDHLASNDVQSIAVVGNNIYLGTALGFFISTDGGFSFRKVEVADKLASANIHSIVVQGNNIYLGTGDGLFVSNDSAKSFRLVTVANGLGANEVKSVGIVGGNIYVGTEQKGLSISGNSGNSFNAIPYIDAVE